MGKPEGKRPLGRPRRRWEDNIKMDLQEVRRACGDWMELAQDTLRPGFPPYWFIAVKTAFFTAIGLGNDVAELSKLIIGICIWSFPG